MEFPCPLSRVCVCVQPVLSQQGRFQLGESGGSLVSSDTCFRPVCCEERHTSTHSTSWTRTTAVRPRCGTANIRFVSVYVEYSVLVWFQNQLLIFFFICSHCNFSHSVCLKRLEAGILIYSSLTDLQMVNIWILKNLHIYVCVRFAVLFLWYSKPYCIYSHSTCSYGQHCHLLVE